MSNNSNSLSDSYRTLDLPLEPPATEAELKAAHKLLVNVWHPDRFTGNPKLQAQATAKLQRINAAREEILEAITVRVRPESHTQGARAGNNKARYETYETAEERQRRDVKSFSLLMKEFKHRQNEMAQVWGESLLGNGRTLEDITAILKAAGGEFKAELWERFDMEPKLRILKIGFIGRALKKWMDKRKQEKKHEA